MSEQNKRETENKRDFRSGRRPGRQSDGRAQHRPLREDVADIDRSILSLLLRRYNLLEKMRHMGRLDPAEEKFLRENWQQEAARISKDAELSGRFFALLQSIKFLPKPGPAGQAGEDNAPKRRDAFNLAPARKPVKISLTAPLSEFATRAWLYLAACAAGHLRLKPVLQNDPVTDCMEALNKLGAAITRDGEALVARGAEAAGYPDKVIYLGDSEFNFYLFVAHYLGRHSRVKFTGDTALKLADFSALRHVLPEFGARLVHVVPKSNGLPVRLECSGLLPLVYKYPGNLSPLFAQALILAAPFYENALTLNLSEHAEKESILRHTVPLLEKCGAAFVVTDSGINIKAEKVQIPHSPRLPMDDVLAAYLCAFANVLGGEASLEGIWPNLPQSNAIWNVAERMKCNWRKNGRALEVNVENPLARFELAGLDGEFLRAVNPDFQPLLTALAACAALRGGPASLPDFMLADSVVCDFLSAVCIQPEEGGKLKKQPDGQHPQIFNAPTPAWAMAIALAACARPGRDGFQLANPGIMTELWPQFWAFYNSLPIPELVKKDSEETKTQQRRRIRTSAVAIVPELKEEDW